MTGPTGPTGNTGSTGDTGPTGLQAVTSTDSVTVALTNVAYLATRSGNTDTTVDDTRGLWLSGFWVETGAGEVGVQRVTMGVNTTTAKWSAYVTVSGLADPGPVSNATVRVYYTYFA